MGYKCYILNFSSQAMEGATEEDKVTMVVEKDREIFRLQDELEKVKQQYSLTVEKLRYWYYKFSVLLELYLFFHQHKKTFKVYKAISDSLENCKIMNCIRVSFILNYLICIIKLWMGSGYT